MEVSRQHLVHTTYIWIFLKDKLASNLSYLRKKLILISMYVFWGLHFNVFFIVIVHKFLQVQHVHIANIVVCM